MFIYLFSGQTLSIEFQIFGVIMLPCVSRGSDGVVGIWKSLAGDCVGFSSGGSTMRVAGRALLGGGGGGFIGFTTVTTPAETRQYILAWTTTTTKTYINRTSTTASMK